MSDKLFEQDVHLEHIAFIPDGNRRWARSKGFASLVGYKRGYNKIKSLTSWLLKYGVKYATFFCFSTENWNRSNEEVSYLMNLLYDLFDSTDEFLHENSVRIEIIGDTSKLPDRLQEKLFDIKEKTINNNKITLIGALSYSGRDEIVRATKKISQDVANQKISCNDICEQMFASYLDMPNIPYPDVLVRTSEQRISNFLLWQMAYSELIFLDKFWPDLDESDVEYIIQEFSKRKRRYGR